MTTIFQHRTRTIFIVAITLTTAAELFYLLVWGMWLFPAGNWAGKVMWTLTCGLAMGSVIGAGTLLWAEPLRGKPAAFWRAVAVFATVGSYCAWLCSAIDTRFGNFGGPENTALFIAAGVFPALAGSIFFSWLVYRDGLTVLTRTQS